jgi:2,3-dihydroxybenzoate decarboxylase
VAFWEILMNVDRRRLLQSGLAAGLTTAVASEVEGASSAPIQSNNRRIRTIALEEHCIPKEVYEAWTNIELAPKDNVSRAAPRPTFRAGATQGGGISDVEQRLQDFEGQRLEDMDRAGIEMAVLSHNVWGPQAQPDPRLAHDMMIRGNDALAKEISKHPDRFAGFGCLSMHEVDAACREFERVISHLGFVGVMLNNWQRTGTNGDGALYYDDKRYDEFWDTAQRLEAPVYLHPGWTPPWYEKSIAGFPLDTANWTWAVEAGTHALRIITSGVFDRFPKAQMILGHNGEHIVTDLWRIEDRMHGGWKRVKGGGALPYSAMKVTRPNYRAEKTVTSYFRTNVSVTTSGQFNDAGLQHVIAAIGVDRVMFSSDYPWEDMVEGGEWFSAAPLSEQDRHAIARGNQLRILGRLRLQS